MVLIYVLFPFSSSMVVKGVVCKKNVAHRRMLSKIEKPRFLILGGALEYQRVTNLLSSFDTLLQQVNLPLSLKLHAFKFSLCAGIYVCYICVESEMLHCHF